MNQIVSLPAPSPALAVAPVAALWNTELPPGQLQAQRQSARDRFLKQGAEAMADLDLLEMILFGAMPKRDTKPVASTLLGQFGNIAAVLSAKPAKLKKVQGVHDNVVAVLKLVDALATRSTRAKLLNRHVLSSWDALLNYCHKTMAHREVEHLRVLFLDRKNRLISDDEMGHGTVDHVPLYPREVMRRALEHNASALILVHNHPTGDPTPSDADIDVTDRICDAADALAVTVHDHLIIGSSGEFSFREAGLL